MSTLEESYALRNDAVLRRRVNAAVWRVAADVWTNSASTPADVAKAAAWLSREGTDDELFMIMTLIGADQNNNGKTVTDDQVTKVVKKVYPQLSATRST